MGSAPFSIFHVFPTFAVGGIQARMADIFNHLGDEFFHTILALDGDYACKGRLSDRLQVDLLKTDMDRQGPIRGLLGRRRILNRRHPHLLMTYNWGAIDWAFANAVAPVCRHIHLESGFGLEESDCQLPRRVFFRRVALARAWRVVVPSETLVRVATKDWRLPSRKIVLIRNGVDCTKFYPARNAVDASGRLLSPAALVVGALGPLRPEKNLTFLLEAVAALTEKFDLRLKVIGKGPDEQALKRKAAELGISERVTFTGHSDSVERELVSLDVFALTSKTEQMPNGILQAMAAGKAVVARDVGDVKHMVSPDNRPLITPKDDFGAFVAALERVLGDCKLRGRAGACNRAYAQKHYTQGRMVEGYRALLLSSLNHTNLSTLGESATDPGSCSTTSVSGD